MVLASFRSAGALRFAKGFGGAGFDQGRAAAADTFGNVYVTGHFEGDVDFGVRSLRGKGSTDVFVASSDANGNIRSVSQLGSDGLDSGTAIAVSGRDLYVVGEFTGKILLNPAPLEPNKKSTDIFIARYSF